MGAEGDSELKLFNPVQFRKVFGRIELCTEPICSSGSKRGIGWTWGKTRG